MKVNYKNIFALALVSFTLSAPALRADEKDLYDFMWLDPDKKVYVLQNKIHKKAKTIYFNAGFGLGLSSTFQDTSMIHTNFGYYITEEWAVEGLYTKYSNSDNDAMENLKRLNGSVPFIRKTESNFGLMAKWSPFYGKINTFNKIFYFDWSFGLGIGKLNTKSNATSVAIPTQANNYADEKYTSVIAKTGLSFHINKNFHIGADIIMNNYKAPGPTINGKSPTSKQRTNTDAVFTLGASF
ncbi:MAG: outer membrane beta-barrel domain-containing protein [Bdellovibrionales bacterium]|nr:outer membrane beta-barrel domain-containing protein [Bdellovibrionales bacterium]